MPDPTDLPTIQRLAFGTTLMLGVVFTTAFGLLAWVGATTGEPLILTTTRYGEAPVEAVLLAVLVGVTAYGMVVADYVLRG